MAYGLSRCHLLANAVAAWSSMHPAGRQLHSKGAAQGAPALASLSPSLLASCTWGSCTQRCPPSRCCSSGLRPHAARRAVRHTLSASPKPHHTVCSHLPPQEPAAALRSPGQPGWTGSAGEVLAGQAVVAALLLACAAGLVPSSQVADRSHHMCRLGRQLERCQSFRRPMVHSWRWQCMVRWARVWSQTCHHQAPPDCNL